MDGPLTTRYLSSQRLAVLIQRKVRATLNLDGGVVAAKIYRSSEGEYLNSVAGIFPNAWLNLPRAVFLQVVENRGEIGFFGVGN
jgi:hypothetical protein